MKGLVIIFLIGVALLLILSSLVILGYILMRNRRMKQRHLFEEETNLSGGQVTEGQTAAAVARDGLDREGPAQVVCINECLTCSLIQMGSSLAYGDNSCPQCGANTTKVYLN
eukprot:TRINITY_DN54556_c0_g1_i1.p1 TRINITY_DN54556_c0_g1~~TRINITY_DN54556_c0_g1_i1.p1  ORF type:complete len:112 (-),score=26.04 TRINITY_DN54556_c0_g1_i1:124-459(-)